MPTISVDKYKLFKELEETFTADSFQQLCFDFGIELDDDTEDDPLRPKNEPPELKIEIPANRYDMLCYEGIVMQLKNFRGQQSMPQFKLLDIPEDKMHTITVSEATARVRPLVAAAILRNIKFTQATYDSFIGLQDKLHQNLARQRTLVSIGTHDLDTIQGPFSYEALKPEKIVFAPLNQKKKMNGAELMTFYETDKHLGKYLHIIRDSDVYPVIYDSKKVVCSLPPIINGDISKITLATTNIFIEVTACDETKLDIVINMVVAMFSQYCADKYTIEPVKVVSEHNGKTRITPSLAARTMLVESDYINACCGLSLSSTAICELLEKMAYTAKPAGKTEKMVEVTIPPTRADVLHPCDVMEDVAIAYGFNSLPRSSPNKTATIGQPLPINKLSDIVRVECAMAGWTEVLPLILCSHDENFAWLNRKDEGTAVKIGNPKSQEFEIVRTSLLPGLLKTIRENKAVRLPQMLIEVADVAMKDNKVERRARNERRWAAAYCGKASGFEIVHGLLDRVMLMLRMTFVPRGADADGYFIDELDEPTFFSGYGAAIYLRLEGKTQRIGELGVLHPTVLEKFELRYPVSTLEINLEVLL